MAVENTAKAEELVRDWLNSRGFYDPAASPVTIPEEFHFIIAGKADNEISFFVIQPKKLDGIIAVLSNVKLGEKHFEAFTKLDDKGREELLWNLQLGIIFAPTAYAFNPDIKDGILKAIQFTKEIYYEDLTRGKLGEAVLDVTKCALWTVLFFRQRFGSSME